MISNLKQSRCLRVRDTPFWQRSAARSGAQPISSFSRPTDHAPFRPMTNRYRVSTNHEFQLDSLPRYRESRPVWEWSPGLMMKMIDYSAAREKCREMDAILSFIGPSDPAGVETSQEQEKKINKMLLISSALCHYGRWMQPHYGGFWLEAFKTWINQISWRKSRSGENSFSNDWCRWRFLRSSYHRQIIDRIWTFPLESGLA